MQLQSIFAAGLIGLASAKPTNPTKGNPPASPWYKINQLARFDNLTPVPVTGGGKVGNNGIYLDIFWRGFGLYGVNLDTGVNPGVVPNTAPNEIASGTLAPQTILTGNPSLTVNYPDSTIDHFDLHSFFGGCVTGLEQGQAALPAACKITVTGVDSKSKTIASKTVHYNPGTGQRVQQMEIDTPGFNSLYAAYITAVADNPALQLTLAFLGDTFNYDVYSKYPIGN